jgi:hypothetical protein
MAETLELLMNLKTTLIAALLAFPGAAISAENNAEAWARAVAPMS